jgi:hypothetical protein
MAIGPPTTGHRPYPSEPPDEILELLGRGEDVEAAECTFRFAVKIETWADGLDWVNKGIFVSVGGRQSGGVIYEVYVIG